MKILGIDPGYDRLGIAIIEKVSGKKEEVVYSNCFTTSPKEAITERFFKIGQEVSRIIDQFQPQKMGIENLFLSKNQKTAMRVAEARGIIIYEATKRNLPICEYSPMEIKMALTGDGTSDKSRIIKMVNLLVKLPNKKALDDEYDAIAVALTCANDSRKN